MVVSKEEECDANFECIVVNEQLASSLYNILYASLHMQNLVDEEEFFANLEGRVLVAEDYEMNRLLLESLFENYPNLDVTFVRNGQEAVDAVLHVPYDLVLMDVNMPVMNGIEATKLIRSKETRHTPIVALTANALKGDKERFLKVGMDDYLTKPIDIHQLEGVLKKHIAKSDITRSEKQSAQKAQSESCFEAFKKIEPKIENIAENIAKQLNLPLQVGQKLIRSFYASLEDAYMQMQEALKSKEYEKVTDLTHKLRGSAGTLRLKDMESLLQKMENVIKEKKECDFNEALDIIRRYLKILDDELNNDV